MRRGDSAAAEVYFVQQGVGSHPVASDTRLNSYVLTKGPVRYVGSFDHAGQGKVDFTLLPFQGHRCPSVKTVFPS